jgi:hypothetical protein
MARPRRRPVRHAGRRRAPLSAAALAVASSLTLASAPGLSGIEPPAPEPAGFGVRSLAPAARLLRGAWSGRYPALPAEVETVRTNARARLVLVRDGLPLRSALVEAAVRVALPDPLATPRGNGDAPRDLYIEADEVPEHLLAELGASPNSLIFVGLSHIAGRSALTLRTTGEPEFRLETERRLSGFTVALAGTVVALPAPPHLSAGLVRNVELVQAGENLLLRIETPSDSLDVRSQYGFDRARSEHVLVLGLAPEGTRVPTLAEVRREMERLEISAGDSCVLEFEEALLEGLELEGIARAHWASGDLADVYRREAMRRLAHLERGTLQPRAGPRLRIASPLDLELALESAGTVQGYLALLGAWARAQTSPATSLRSLIAPELDPDAFEPIHRDAEEGWRACTGAVRQPATQ